ncbi:beta strand repeat-containing protein, partial [Donghicola tyrosinivorans]
TALTTDGDTGTAFTVESTSSGNTTTGAGNGTAITSALTSAPAVTLAMADTLNMTGSFAQVGETISYSFTVTNTGNVTLTNLNLTNTNAMVSGGPIASLVPGASDTVTYTAVHTITQTDLDAGSVTNSATIIGSSPTGSDDVSDSSSATGTGDTPTVTSLPTVPELTVTKTVSSNDVDSSGTLTAGDILTYTVVATNSGSVTVSDLSLSDDFTRADNTVLGASLGTPAFSSGASAASFPSGATATVTMTHTVTQADIDAGGLSNNATATAWVDGDNNSTRAGDGSEDVTDTTDMAVTNSVTRAGGISLVKTATLGSGTPAAGDTVTYAFTVTNTGNVTLTNVVLTDAGVTLTGGPIASLLPGASDSTSYTASYVLTQSDIDSGSVGSTALVTATTPMASQVTDTSTTDTALTQAADIAIAKTVSHTDADQSGTVTLGDTLTYTITVTNSGNTTLRDVAITEDFRRADNTVLTATVPAANFSTGSTAALMLPGAVATTSFAHVVTQADVDAGGVTNSATATAWSDDDGSGTKTGDGSETVSDTLSQALSTPIAGTAGIALKKSGELQDIDGTLGTSLGDKIVYTLEVKNTGNVTLTNVTLSDPLFGGTVAQTIASLAPGQTDSLTFVLDYMITTADLNTGSVSNLATVSATAGTGSVSDQSGPTFDTDEAIVTFLGSIGGHVTDGSTGKQGVTVILYDQSTGLEVARTTTDSTGLYKFLELEQATYSIRFVPPGDVAVQSRSERGNPQGETVQNIEVAAGADRVITEVDALVVDPSGVVYDAITRQPLQDATVTLLFNGSEVPNSWLDTAAGDSNNKVTGSDGRYSFLLQSPAQSGTYSLRVSHADYSFVSDIIPPQSGTYTPALGLGVEEIVASSDLPSASGGDETYYLNFGFTFGDWTNSATLSKGIVHNHIPMDPNGYTTGLRVTKTADASGLSSFPEVGEVITYAITVQNLGQLDYDTVSLDDPLTSDEALVAEVGVTDDGILGAGEIWRYTASYTLTAADLRRGEVSNLATLQATLLAGSTATSGAAPTGSDIGGVHVYESRPTGNTLRGTGNGEATVVTITPDMIAMIKDDLTDILSDDIRVTMQRQSAQISEYSADALDWLKASLRFSDGVGVVPCASNSDPLSGKVNASGGSLDLETDWQRELCNADTGVRVVDQLSLTLTHDDDLGTQHLLSFAHRKERLRGDDRVTGNFIGGYLSQSAVTDKADGTIAGLGVNGGFYGAGRISEEMFYSYHLAGVVGRHSYDLDFERDRTINATGDFTYFGLFAGASLAGDLSFSDTIVTPRVGIDLYHAPDTTTDVTATSGPFKQSGNLTVDGVTGNRTFLEVRLANDPSKAFDGEGMWDGLGGALSLTLRGFCDSFDGLDSRCGAGGAITYDKVNPETGRAFGFELDAEATEQHTAVRGSLALTRYFAKGQGSSVFALRAGSTGAPQLSYELNLAF